MRLFRFAGLGLASAGAVVFFALQASAQQAITCNTVAGTTYCSDGTQYRQADNGEDASDPIDKRRPNRQSVGGSGPTMYEQLNNRIYGADQSTVRLLGNTNYGTSGRNCAQFATSYICD